MPLSIALKSFCSSGPDSSDKSCGTRPSCYRQRLSHFLTHPVLPTTSRLDQQDDPRYVRMLHRVHRVELELSCVLFQRRKRLVYAQSVGSVWMRVDHWVVSGLSEHHHDHHDQLTAVLSYLNFNATNKARITNENEGNIGSSSQSRSWDQLLA
jgi:hypothetical protein